MIFLIKKSLDFLFKTITVLTFFFLFFISCSAQENSENSPAKNSSVTKINSEKLAWEMMYPATHKKSEKTAEMKFYEELLLKMRAGTAELSLLMGEFEMQKFSKHEKKK